MKVLLFIFLLCPLFCCAQTTEDLMKRIDSDVAAIDERYTKSRRDFILRRKLNKRKTVSEKWTYSIRKGSLEFLSISRRSGDSGFSESYYMKNGRMFFASEYIAVYFRDEPGEISQGWSARYYFDGRKLIDAPTIGHGKSEADDWNPEKELPARLKARLKQLRRKLNPRR